MNSVSDDAALPAPGCPIRKSSAHSPLSGSPKLIAASHVLHRLLAPRHPPYALSSLTTDMPNYQVFALLDPDLLCTRMQLSKTKRRRPRSGLDPRCVPHDTHRASVHSVRSGADRDRTDDLRLARAALSQLSYSPSAPSQPEEGGPR